MKVRRFPKTFSFCMTLNIALGSVFGMLSGSVIPVNAQAAHLEISRKEFSGEEALPQGEYAILTVTASDVQEGFLATSFGITYDPRLVLTNVETVGAFGEAHSFASNPENHMLWIQGASGTPLSSLNTEEFLVLEFQLPEDCSAGDEMPVEFLWNAADLSEAYWYTGSHSNIIGDIKGTAKSGGFSISNPNQPVLSRDALQLNQEESQTLTVEKYTGSVLWFSDNVNVATVENGVVTGRSPGSCKIYASTSNGIFICDVVVTEEQYDSIIETDEVHLTSPDQTVILTCPGYQEVTWISSDPTKVTVENGVLRGLNRGMVPVFAICGTDVFSTIVYVEFEEFQPAETQPVQTETTAEQTEPLPTETEPQTAEILYGDITLDGAVNVQDVILLSKSLLGAVKLTEESRQSADAYKDGKVDSNDVSAIIHALVQLVTLPYYAE